MFGDFEEQQAREQLRAIASSYAGRLSSKEQRLALEWLTLILERWKYEQAAAQGRTDGTIEIETTVGLLGTPRSRVVSLDDAKPEDCAGPSIRSAHDLFWRLYDEKYPPLADAANKLGADTFAALLVQRDTMKMPLSSVAFATRMLFIFQESKAHVFREMLSAKQRAEADRMANLRAKKAAKKAERPDFRKAEWRSAAADIYRQSVDVLPKRVAVAAQIQAEKAQNVAIGTIENAIKGVRKAVIAEGLRAAKRRKSERF